MNLIEMIIEYVAKVKQFGQDKANEWLQINVPENIANDLMAIVGDDGKFIGSDGKVIHVVSWLDR